MHFNLLPTFFQLLPITLKCVLSSSLLVPFVSQKASCNKSNKPEKNCRDISTLVFVMKLDWTKTQRWHLLVCQNFVSAESFKHPHRCFNCLLLPKATWYSLSSSLLQVIDSFQNNFLLGIIVFMGFLSSSIEKKRVFLFLSFPIKIPNNIID